MLIPSTLVMCAAPVWRGKTIHARAVVHDLPFVFRVRVRLHGVTTVNYCCVELL